MNEQLDDARGARDGARRFTAWIPRLLAVGGSMVLMSVLVTGGSRAAFNATTTNGGNSFAAGTVVLDDDASGSVMFNLSNMKPGDTATKCLNVAYTGSLPANVHLYSAVSGTLATYLNTVVDVGTGAAGGATLSCTGFAGGSPLSSGTLAALGASHNNFANGLAGFDGATNPATKSYRVIVTLQDNNASQAQTASATFTWEAESV